MEILCKFWKLNCLKCKFTRKKYFFFVVFTVVFSYLVIVLFQTKTKQESTEVLSIKENIELTLANIDTSIGFDGIKMLYPTEKNARIWYSKWSSGTAKFLKSAEVDPSDLEYFVRGNGSVFINGNGSAFLKGSSPRMYIYDSLKEKKWNDVEVTVYAKRIQESGITSSQGIVIGARSEHQDATHDSPCFGSTYYGRLLYDGRAVFQKEVIHEGAYSDNKPTETNKAIWNTFDGTMPRNIWIGVKFIVKTKEDGESVKLELYRDLTNGKNGGVWEKVAEYIDSGNWSQVNSEIDVVSVCGYSPSKVLINPGTSVFIRNDEVEAVEYKLFSIREI